MRHPVQCPFGRAQKHFWDLWVRKACIDGLVQSAAAEQVRAEATPVMCSLFPFILLLHI